MPGESWDRASAGQKQGARPTSSAIAGSPLESSDALPPNTPKTQASIPMPRVAHAQAIRRRRTPGGPLRGGEWELLGGWARRGRFWVRSCWNSGSVAEATRAAPPGTPLDRASHHLRGCKVATSTRVSLARGSGAAREARRAVCLRRHAAATTRSHANPLANLDRRKEDAGISSPSSTSSGDTSTLRSSRPAVGRIRHSS